MKNEIWNSRPLWQVIKWRCPSLIKLITSHSWKAHETQVLFLSCEVKVVSEASGFLRWLISISWQVHEHLKKLLEFGWINHWNSFPSLPLQCVLKLKRQWIIWVMILLDHFLTAAIIRPDLGLSGRRTEQKRRLTPSRWVAIPEYFLVFLVKLCQVPLSDGNSDLPRHRQPHSPVKNMWTY